MISAELACTVARGRSEPARLAADVIRSRSIGKLRWVLDYSWSWMLPAAVGRARATSQAQDMWLDAWPFGESSVASKRLGPVVMLAARRHGTARDRIRTPAVWRVWRAHGGPA